MQRTIYFNKAGKGCKQYDGSVGFIHLYFDPDKEAYVNLITYKEFTDYKSRTFLCCIRRGFTTNRLEHCKGLYTDPNKGYTPIDSTRLFIEIELLNIPDKFKEKFLGYVNKYIFGISR